MADEFICVKCGEKKGADEMASIIFAEDDSVICYCKGCEWREEDEEKG